MDQHPNLGLRLGWDLLIHPTLDWYFFYLELKVALDSINLVSLFVSKVLKFSPMHFCLLSFLVFYIGAYITKITCTKIDLKLYASFSAKSYASI